jgi:type II secretory pathway pseudopilin PulG
MKSFTLIEILISILIFTFLVSFLTVGINFYKRQELENQAQNIVETLRKAQLKSISGEFDSSFGVHFEESDYILFKGNSFSERDPDFDEVFNLPPLIKLEGLSEIVFLKTEGMPKENPAYCGGSCIPCGNFDNRGDCLAQDGCSWNARYKICSGNCTPCQNYQNQIDCENQSGCTWYSETRGGNIILKANGESKTIKINEVGAIAIQ